jgi:hypothetical protein
MRVRLIGVYLQALNRLHVQKCGDRPISEKEYKMFTTQWIRVMTAWMGMMSTFCLASLIYPVATDANET